MAEELSALLSGWGLSDQVISNFVAEDWNVTSIQLISEDQIVKLIPKEGPRTIFVKKLEQLLQNTDNTRNETLSEEEEADNQILVTRAKRRKLDSSQLQLITDEQDISPLHALLKKNLQGVMVLGQYKAHNALDHYTRDLLCSIIVFHELEGNCTREFTRDQWSTIADDIVKLFPNESKETWFNVVRKDNTTTVHGRLRFKYYSIRRSLIQSLLIPKRDQETAVEPNNPVDLGDDKDDEAFMWLLSYKEPWDEQVVPKWEATRARRQKHLQLCEYVHEYFKKFPALAEPLGWKLIASDGQADQPNLELSLQELWVEYSLFLLTLIRRDQPNFLKARKFSSLSSDQQFVYILKELPNLFKVRGLPKSPLAGKKDKAWKVSRQEVADALCLHVTEIASIQESINGRKKSLEKYKYSLQPVPVFLGKLGSIQQSFILMDDIRWEVSNPFEAVAGCFQLAFGLGAEYPIEAKHIWLFLQKTLYKIETSRDYFKDSALRSFLASRLKEYTLFTARK